MSEAQKTKILSQRGGSALRKEKSLVDAKVEASRLLSSRNREDVVALTMLYWAEGNKESLVFTNTDSKMIGLFIALIRKIFGINNDRICVTVRTFTDMDYPSCVKYWSKVTGLDEKSINLHKNGLTSRGSSAYGVCRLTIKRGGYTLKVLKEVVAQYCSRSSMDRTRVS